MSASPVQPVVIWFGRVGDMIMLTALLEILHRRFGRACRVIGAGAWSQEIYEGQPDVAETLWLRRYTPLAVAVALSALAFTAHHTILLGDYFPGRFWLLAVPLSVGVAIGGAVWAWIYERTGSLDAPWISHIVVDAALMAIGWAMIAPYLTPLAG